MRLVDAETERVVGETYRSHATANRPFGAEWRDQAECKRVIIVTPPTEPRAQWYFPTEQEARLALMEHDLGKVLV